MRARQRDDGSALMLVPAGVLVLILLGALAIDSAVVMFAQRDLQNRTAAVSNDAVTVALDEATFYDEGAIALSADRVATYTAAAFAPSARPDGYEAWGAQAVVTDRTVEVRAWADVSTIFLPSLPGMARTTRVEATSIATARGA